jgi:hypothetical protein
VLITAGGPTGCNDSLSALTQIAGEAAQSRRPVYVVQLGNDFDLNVAAHAGSNGPVYLIAGADIAAQLALILQDLTPRLASTLPMPPIGDPAYEFDLQKTEVVLHFWNESVLQRGLVPRLGSTEDCDLSPNGGWYFDTPDNQLRIALCPCTSALDSSVLSASFHCK